jgi:hypothetical protein
MAPALLRRACCRGKVTVLQDAAKLGFLVERVAECLGREIATGREVMRRGAHVKNSSMSGRRDAIAAAARIHWYAVDTGTPNLDAATDTASPRRTARINSLRSGLCIPAASAPARALARWGLHSVYVSFV